MAVVHPSHRYIKFHYYLSFSLLLKIICGFAIMHSVSVNSIVRVKWCSLAKSYIPRSGIAKSAFQGNAQMFSKMAVPIYTPTAKGSY